MKTTLIVMGMVPVGQLCMHVGKPDTPAKHVGEQYTNKTTIIYYNLIL